MAEKYELNLPNQCQKEMALLIRGLCFSYPDNPGVLRDIHLSVSPAERVGIIGPNGAGKSTLFLLICGVLQAEAGCIHMFGKLVKSGQFNPEAAMVFQRSDDQLFCPSVKEDVAFGPQNMGLSPIEVNRRVQKALSTVNCLELSSRPIHHLSEGEKKLVAIAGILAMNPAIINYDEPSAGLDMKSRRELISLLKKSRETLLIASHDLELILEVCTRVILMDKGVVIADGEPRRIMGDRALMEAHGQEKPHSLTPHFRRHFH